MPTPDRTNLAPVWALPAFLVAVLSLGTIGYVITQNTVTQTQRVQPGDVDANDDSLNDNLINDNLSNATASENMERAAIIVDASVYNNASDKMSLLGKRMRLQNVVVESVPGDHVFSVMSEDASFFAALDPQLDTRGGMEYLIRVKPGDMRTLQGEFKQTLNAPISAPDIREQLTTAQVYFHVTGISEPAVESESLQ